MPHVGRYPRQVRSLLFVCIPGTGEITINCTHTLLEIQDKYKGERREKKIPVRDTVFPIEPRCSVPPRPKGAATFHNSLGFFSPFPPLIRQAL